MSIIHDALKKVEIRVDTPMPQLSKPSAPAPRPSAKKRGRGPSFLLVVCVILLLALAGAAFRPKKPGVKKTSPPPRHITRTGGYALSGVFNSGNEAYAILNDKVVKTGDTVDGAVVREIREDEIIIEAGGVAKHLSTRLK